MVNKCCIYNCNSNYNINDHVTVFSFPKDIDLRNRWVKFVNRQNWQPTNSSVICIKHFEPRYYKKGKKDERYRLLKRLKPVPTIFDPSKCNQNSYISNIVSPVSIPRRSPRKRILQQDELQKFRDLDLIKDFESIDKSHGPANFTFEKHGDHVLFYKLELNESLVPEIKSCIQIDINLHVKLFYKSSPLPLPEWFRSGHDCKLTRKSMLQNFPAYIESRSLDMRIFDELEKLRYKKRPTYSPNILRFALLQRYTSLQSYKMLQKELPLPSISLLQKLTKGNIDTIECAKALKLQGKISEDICLIFDEMYLQKHMEYATGETFGANENGDLYRGLLNFMIIGLKESVPYVVKSCPETTIESEWLKNEILSCLVMLKKCGFKVRLVVCDNCATNVSSYRKLLTQNNQDIDDLYLDYDGEKIYLCFDSVHLVKNIRNNLLNRKRFLFPTFVFDGFRDKIHVEGGEIRWKLFHDVHEKDSSLQAYLRKARKLNLKVLHPGNCKQNVPIALAIFDETTSAAIKSYFPSEKSAANFLQLINKWWTIVNSKKQFSESNYLGNGAVANDDKPRFLRALATWIEKWESQKIRNCEKFTLTSQTAGALVRTLRCHACLIEDLLAEGYKYVLPAKFQSDPLERRFGQYRQMSGGRFLVGLKETAMSEKILKIKCLVKAGLDIKFTEEINEDEITNFLFDIEALNILPENMKLSDDSREVAVHIAGYIAKKIKKRVGICCSCYLTGNKEVIDSNPDYSYLDILSRGGLVIPSIALYEFVSTVFAILDYCDAFIRNSKIPKRQAAEILVSNTFDSYESFTCEKHEVLGKRLTLRVIVNIFLNNQVQVISQGVVTDNIKEF